MILKIEHLKLPELAPFDFEIKENGLYGVIGRNGIGKSTLFSILSGQIGLTEGKIKAGRVAYLASVETFDENLKMNDYFKILKMNERQKAERLLHVFEAEKISKKHIGTFSLGMKEFFATILCLSVGCEILVIDELLSGLDISKKAKVYEEIKSLATEKIILITSHHLKEIEHFCDQTYLLSEEGLHLVTDFEAAAQAIGYMDIFF
ncbi:MULTISPECIES: ATP-binding cassette domain-containing protein [unclassified Lactococcus]|uniref:ATP-binding cassette domain-containing protein n=1 Tax=unclassified Lactococcus TaxID=2643510 RepID=UPI0011C9967B|nr:MULTISPECIES: ATP-binding cassette domain-containing protein [unclassified Lactococcus]MQW23545.1 ATP-binding cassette domain-containing protein [Lactococcus sp. dk101]TXK37766.1 ATP-binding cassette domain-containing protein [Lactococcus sp. dk310]TXK49149.1 ATP-binding cassette domain-containing protein [Lactococcus sp. dk322]